MKIFNFIKNFFISKKNLKINQLPSQGIFYNDDLKIEIKKVNKKEIKKYEHEYVQDNLGIIINNIKNIVENNIIVTNGTFNDIKSIDIIYIFIEIVKFTKSKEIKIKFIDNKKEKTINFNSQNFNYFDIHQYMKHYNSVDKSFNINGYKYTLPSIGIENCLTNFLISKINQEKYNNYYYDFIYFLGNKNYLKFEEIENLIQIFNSDIDDNESEKINEIIVLFLPLQKYSLIKNGKVIEIQSTIDLQNIWK